MNDVKYTIDEFNHDVLNYGYFKQDGFDIRFEFMDEWVSVRDCFDDSCHDVSDYENKISTGELDWFVCRCVVSLCGIDLGTDSLGGILHGGFYSWLQIESDGYAKDLKEGAIREAQEKLQELFKRNHREID